MFPCGPEMTGVPLLQHPLSFFSLYKWNMFIYFNKIVFGWYLLPTDTLNILLMSPLLLNSLLGFVFLMVA